MEKETKRPGIDQWEAVIRKALKRSQTYTAAIDVQIKSLATAVYTLTLAAADIERLDETFVWVETRYGREMKPHPVFKVQKDAQDSITRQMKALGLTVEALSADTETDPLVDLTKKIIATR